MAISNMKASLLFCRFTYNFYNSLILQILKLANDNPSCYSSIRILKYYLQTERALLWLLLIWTIVWSGKNQNQLFPCLYSFPHLMPLKDWRNKLHRIYALLCSAKQLALSSLKINASNHHFEYRLACYGSSMQQNVCIGSMLLISLRPTGIIQLLTGTRQSWQRRPVLGCLCEWLGTVPESRNAKESDLRQAG